MLFLLPTLIIGAVQVAAPVQLKRIFTPGLVSKYTVSAALQVESRGRLGSDIALMTFIPQDVDIDYTFTTHVLSVNSGIASVRYSRPKIVETRGETENSGPKAITDKLDQIVVLSVSQINEILDFKDLTPKKKKKPGDASAAGVSHALRRTASARQIQEFVTPFVAEVERLSVFIGGFDTSMDFSPKLDLGAVRPGDTWKRTVGYQPQKLKSKSGKTVVQRLDLTYTYKGQVHEDGKDFTVIHADVKLDTDLGKYLNDLYDLSPDQTHVKSIPLSFDSGIDFKLDPKTLQTITAKADSHASFKVFVTDFADPVQEENIKGSNILELVSNKLSPTK